VEGRCPEPVEGRCPEPVKGKTRSLSSSQQRAYRSENEAHNTGVLFIDASRECKAGKNQNLLTEENIAKVVETYRNRSVIDKYSYLATLDEIKENDYN